MLDFEPQRLRAFLRKELPWLGPDIAFTRAGGGQSNPTYFLTAEDTQLVLRKRPAGVGAGSAHDVLREHRLISTLGSSAVPVPRALLACDDASVIGDPFYIMERVEGTIFHHASLDEVAASERLSYYITHAETLASLHQVDWQELGLSDLARPGSFLTRQVRRWTDVWGDRRTAELDHLRPWLLQHLPSIEGQALVHGDYKFNNLVFHEQRPQLIAVLDWELATIGDPLLDLAHFWCATWATSPDEYGGILGLDLAAQGLPRAESYVDAYESAAGTSSGLPSFYRVLALLRNAGIFLGIGERARAGTAAAANAEDQARLADVYFERALSLTT